VPEKKMLPGETLSQAYRRLYGAPEIARRPSRQPPMLPLDYYGPHLAEPVVKELLECYRKLLAKVEGLTGPDLDGRIRTLARAVFGEMIATDGFMTLVREAANATPNDAGDREGEEEAAGEGYPGADAAADEPAAA
jgi:hypothetical protein